MLRGAVSRTKSLLTLDRFEVVEKDAFVLASDGRKANITRQGLSTGPAVSILPYVRNPKSSDWHVVLVSEFRPMVDEIDLEAPGGLIEPNLGPEEQMVKVLIDETNLTVAQNLIKIVGIKWKANSFSDQKVWLGTIEIVTDDLERFKKNLRGRSNPEGELEMTEVEIIPLLYLLKNRHFKLNSDLTSYQIIELALSLGLIKFSE